MILILYWFTFVKFAIFETLQVHVSLQRPCICRSPPTFNPTSHPLNTFHTFIFQYKYTERKHSTAYLHTYYLELTSLRIDWVKIPTPCASRRRVARKPLFVCGGVARDAKSRFVWQWQPAICEDIRARASERSVHIFRRARESFRVH